MMNCNAPICIVGAGMSGILAAERLRRLGYQNIDLIEAQGQLGGYSETVEIDGRVYDFQAHLLAMQDFGPDMSGTAVQELLDRYPMGPGSVHDEALYFVGRSRSGRARMGVPPNFVPLLKTLTPTQIVDQLVEAWNLIEGASRRRTGPGLAGLAFDRAPGETWEAFRARHAPLVGEALQSIAIYANMRRPWQPAECIINANAQIPGNMSQLAKLVLSAFPDQREQLLARMPASLVAQIGSALPIARSFVGGFNGFLRKIVRDCGLEVLLHTRVTGMKPLGPDSPGSPDLIEVSFLRGAENERFSKRYARVLVTTRPRQTRDIFPAGEVGELFSERSCPSVWTRSYVVKVRDEVLPFPTMGGAESLGFWLIDPYANYTDSDVEQSLHRITGANKQHESPYWVCFSNSDRSISDAEAWAIAKDSLFLFKDPELIAERISNWPVYPSAAAVRDGWFDKLAAIQGRDGIYFLGEVVSGPTIESISAHVRDVIPRWFGDR